MTNTEIRAELRRRLVRYRRALRVWSMAEIAGELAGDNGTALLGGVRRDAYPVSGVQFFAGKIRACERELRLTDGGV